VYKTIGGFRSVRNTNPLPLPPSEEGNFPMTQGEFCHLTPSSARAFWVRFHIVLFLGDICVAMGDFWHACPISGQDLGVACGNFPRFSALDAAGSGLRDHLSDRMQGRRLGLTSIYKGKESRVKKVGLEGPKLNSSQR